MEDLSVLAQVSAKEGEHHVPFLFTNQAEHSGKALVTDGRVPGRLLGRHCEYTELGAEPYVVETVRGGYKLEFEGEPPPPSYTRNIKSALEDPGFVKKELERLEQLGCLLRVEERPYITLPLSLVFSGKLRLVVDASRGLNPYCLARGIKLEDLSHVARTLRKNDWMVVNDLDSGYWHSAPRALEVSGGAPGGGGRHHHLLGVARHVLGAEGRGARVHQADQAHHGGAEEAGHARPHLH